jgi:hypothetical protein
MTITHTQAGWDAFEQSFAAVNGEVGSSEMFGEVCFLAPCHSSYACSILVCLWQKTWQKEKARIIEPSRQHIYYNIYA